MSNHHTAGLLLAGLLLSQPALALNLKSTVTEVDRVPVPRANYRAPNDPNMIFYLQRSTNANTIVYAANMLKRGQIDPDKPVHVYWRLFDEDGRTLELTFFQRFAAYGMRADPVEGHPGSFEASIVAYPNLKLRIGVDGSGAPEATLDMQGHKARAVSAYVQLNESGLVPSLVYMDVYGIDKASGHILHEHFEPAKD